MTSYYDECLTHQEKLDFLADFICQEMEEHQKEADRLKKILDKWRSGKTGPLFLEEMKAEVQGI